MRKIAPLAVGAATLITAVLLAAVPAQAHSHSGYGGGYGYGDGYGDGYGYDGVEGLGWDPQNAPCPGAPSDPFLISC
ncbi:hypothetical protein AB0L06_39205 [Spirillospora sp. NPDC052269]